MKLSFAVPVLAAIAFAASVPSALAFEAVNNDQFQTGTLSTRLSDPDDLIQDMSQRYNGNSATIVHLGNTTLGIVGPGGGYGAGNSPFVPDPAAGTVPSKREW
jgi:hypothetical protein